MAARPTEMGNSYVCLLDLYGDERIVDDEINFKVEGDNTLVITYYHYDEWPAENISMTNRFDIPQNANLDAISAVSQNGMLIVTIKKTISRLSAPWSIKVTKA
ncbi:hypothetical protein MKW94_002105 [Papaver nudicaule]|uniref:SHSP domain-containing protein n=1 Tax=Papaver nudicaule TaxID=74823 RepID=A0AA42AZT5_PAPNU|nr:hypothetical protein [Papaver nudicaule]